MCIRDSIVSDIKNQKVKCKKEVWEYLAFVLKDVVKTYRDSIAKIETDTLSLNTQIKTLIAEGNHIAVTGTRKLRFSTSSAIRTIR